MTDAPRTSFQYLKAAEAQITRAEDQPVDTPASRALLARAQVLATLAVAAATREQTAILERRR